MAKLEKKLGALSFFRVLLYEKRFDFSITQPNYREL